MEWSAYPCERRRLGLNLLSLYWRLVWPRSVKVNGKALEQRAALAVSAWPVPLSPLGFSTSNPNTGSESLAYWCSSMPSLGGVRHLSVLSHWHDLPVWVGGFFLGFGLSMEFFLSTVFLHLHCLLIGVLGWVSVQHFEISADVRRAI